ncbi:hypothetical protein H1R20_g15733, partial [Candolleomyces eurysporus]
MARLSPATGQAVNETTVTLSVPRSTIKGVRNSDFNRGAGSLVAPDVANANPGDTPAIDWRTGDLSFSVIAKLPENIRTGDYLIRHEITALHVAQNQGGAKFYAACTQIRIGGSGTDVASEDELLSFPVTYGDNDAGILVRNVFDNRLKYQFPGPAVSRLAGIAAPAGDPSPLFTKTSSGSKSISTSGNSNGNSGSCSGKKTCRLRKNASKFAAAAAPFHDPHFVPPPPLGSHRRHAHRIFGTTLIVLEAFIYLIYPPLSL